MPPCSSPGSGVTRLTSAASIRTLLLAGARVATRCGRVEVFTLVFVLAGLMEPGSVVAYSLFLLLSDSNAARDQRAAAGSSRPGVRRPSLLARKP